MDLSATMLREGVLCSKIELFVAGCACRRGVGFAVLLTYAFHSEQSGTKIVDLVLVQLERTTF